MVDADTRPSSGVTRRSAAKRGFPAGSGIGHVTQPRLTGYPIDPSTRRRSGLNQSVGIKALSRVALFNETRYRL